MAARFAANFRVIGDDIGGLAAATIFFVANAADVHDLNAAHAALKSDGFRGWPRRRLNQTVISLFVK